MASEPRCICDHRKYDHETEDASCWKCPCLRYQPVPREEPRP